MDDRFKKLENFDGVKEIEGDILYYYRFVLTDDLKLVITDIDISTEDLGLSVWFSDQIMYYPHSYEDKLNYKAVPLVRPLIVSVSTTQPTYKNNINLPAGIYYLNIMNNTGGMRTFTIKELEV